MKWNSERCIQSIFVFHFVIPSSPPPFHILNASTKLPFHELSY